MKKILSKMIELLVHFYSGNSEPSQRMVNQRIARKFNLWVAEKKFCRPDAPLASIAEEFGVSEEELSYFFSTVVGSRFSTVRKRLRLEEARRLINENPWMKLILVANRVGIMDKCNFRRQFKEMYGYTPSEWQRECQHGRIAK